MKTHDVEQLYDITKRTLTYYEEEGLIKPTRDANGYHNYNQEDLRLLEIILKLRTYDLSINEIKQIFNKEISLQSALKSKQNQIQESIKQQYNIISSIEKNLERRKASITYQRSHLDTEVAVCFKDDSIEIDDIYNNVIDKKISLDYNNIIEIKLSICTRIYSRHISDGSSSITGVEDTYKANNGNVPGLVTVYYVDFDIITNEANYQYESTSLRDMDKIMQLIRDKQVNVDDPLDLITFFIENNDNVRLETLLLQNLKKWSKIIDIDNPRSIEVQNQTKYVKKNLDSFVNPKAGKIKITKKGIFLPQLVSLPKLLPLFLGLFLLFLCIWGLYENYLSKYF